MKTQKTFRKLNAKKIIAAARSFPMSAGGYALIAKICGHDYEVVLMRNGDIGLRYCGALYAVVETTAADHERLESRLSDMWDCEA